MIKCQLILHCQHFNVLERLSIVQFIKLKANFVFYFKILRLHPYKVIECTAEKWLTEKVYFIFFMTTQSLYQQRVTNYMTLQGHHNLSFVRLLIENVAVVSLVTMTKNQCVWTRFEQLEYSHTSAFERKSDIHSNVK